MRIPLLMIFSFVTVIGAWAAKALEDGKITADEGLELIEKLAGLLGVPLELNVSEEVTETIKDITGEQEVEGSKALFKDPDFDSSSE